MKRTGFYIVVLFCMILISCSKPDAAEMKSHLNGYWEITQVEMPDGKTKDYKISTLVDYIEIKKDSGLRTKVAPRLDGSFMNNGVSEKFAIKIENDSLNLYYSTPFDSWKETVLKAEDSTLVIKNRDNKTYIYTKFVKFDIEI